MRIILILLVTLLIQWGNAVSQIRISAGQNLYSLKESIELELDSIHSQIGDSAFYHEGGFFNEYQKWISFWEPRLFPHGNFGDYMEGYYQGTLDVISRFPYYLNADVPENNQTPWSEIGPIRRPENGITDIGNGGCDRGTGPVKFISFYKNNPNEMLCGSPNGGLYYSNNAGSTWSNAGSDIQWHNSDCSWAMFHDTNSDIWYASNSGSEIGKTRGIYRTFNKGQQWAKILDSQILGSGELDRIYKMILDFNQPDDVLYVAMSHGLFKSTTLSNTNPTFFQMADPLVDGRVFDIEMKTNNSNVIMASVRDKINLYSWRIVYTLNGGSSWNQILNVPIAINNIPFPQAETDTRSAGITIEGKHPTKYILI